MQSYQNNIIEQTLQNKGFLLLDEMFKNNSWYLIKNDMNWISYTKQGDETSFFEIKVGPSRIYVSIPVKNSTIQYKTSFDNYFNASEYVEQRFKDFIQPPL